MWCVCMYVYIYIYIYIYDPEPKQDLELNETTLKEYHFGNFTPDESSILFLNIFVMGFHAFSDRRMERDRKVG